MGKKIIAASIVVIAVAGFILGYIIFIKPGSVPSLNPVSTIQTLPISQEEKQASQVDEKIDLGKPATSVSEITSGIEAQLLAEDEKINVEDSDAAAVIDQTALDDLGQSYDENEL